MIEFFDRFFDPLAFSLVVGGTALATWISATGKDGASGFAALAPFFRARPARDAETADRAVRRIQHLSEYKGTFCADRVKTPVDFVHRAACRLADAGRAEDFATWAREEMEDRRARHAAAIGLWRHAAEVAPAMGMIGTVIGLIAMFARMNDPAAMAPALAVAMLTTLYGLVLAFGICGPVAARLQRLSDAECAWQARTVERLVALARAEEEMAQDAWQLRRLRRAG
ncbi:MAG: MotA/TolQ/ExbB proton channel family protein [Sphingomonadaceae bacterium]|nr:MotA/TolQ/ExbB proton channel family protein [Sphingomonadaceae bacterium]